MPDMPTRFPFRLSLLTLLLTLFFTGPLAAQIETSPAEAARIKAEVLQKEANGTVTRAKRHLTRDLIVFLAENADPAAYARDNGLTLRGTLSRDAGIYLMAAESVEGAVRRSLLAKIDNRAKGVFVNEYVDKRKYAFVPNDPYFPLNSPSGYPGQWYLSYAANASLDTRVQGAWNRNITGTGVTIGIVDDGVPGSHPDLAPNYVASKSYDFGSNDSDPSPSLVDDMHGTSVAGVAAARGGNGIGITGAAPYASLAGLRVLFEGSTVAMYVQATTHLSTGSSPTIQVKNHSYGPYTPFENLDAELTALEQSAAAGTIHVFAAGNDRGTEMEDAARQLLLNSPSAISVVAMGSNGKFASYSSYGANSFVTAPSSSFSQAGLFAVTTTDRVGSDGYNAAGTSDPGSDPFPDVNYTGVFGGTSSAAPLVAGIMALGRQANPSMNVRLAKHLLVRSSDIVDASDATASSDGGWITNGAGFRFNQNYGFGRIDADEFTQMAAQYRVSALQTESVAPVTVEAPIPDASPAGISETFHVSSTTPLEEVLVHLNITHTYRGDLSIYLVSPQGTRSRLLAAAANDHEDVIDWTFASNAFWGENPQGNWTLQVVDGVAQDTGTLHSFSATMRMGTIYTVGAIRGTVTFNGVGLAGVTVTANGPTTLTTTTAANGSYSFNEPTVGTYTITVAKTGYTFTPPSQTVTVTVGDATANFTAATVTYIARDIALTGDGSVRILQVTSTSARIAKVTGSTAQYGEVRPIPTGWTPASIAAGADGKTRLLWSGPGGALALMIFTSAGVRESYQSLGTYPGVTSKDIAVAGDGSVRILQLSASVVRILKVAGSNLQYGAAVSIPSGWTPVAIAAGSDNKTRLLWSGPGSAVSVMTFNAVGARESYQAVGTYSGVASKDIAVAGDGSVRILQVSATLARILKVTGSTLQYGPTVSVPAGWTPAAIASGADNKTRLLWSNDSGALGVMTFNASGSREAYVSIVP